MNSHALGRPIPDSIHAVSMSLPRWADVVGYEEKTPAVMSRITNGYPRFVIHPLVQQMAKQLGRLPFPSARVTEMAADFARRSGVAESDELKNFWQHTGLIVSSRQAEAFLAGRKVADAPEVFQSRRH